MRYIEVLEQCLGRKAVLDLLPLQPGDVLQTSPMYRAWSRRWIQAGDAARGRYRPFVEWYREYYRA